MCAIVSVTGSGCCPVRGAGWNATRRCTTPWRGPMTCSTTTSATVLERCSVFAGGFDLAAATHVCDDAPTSTPCWTCWIRWCASRWSPSSAVDGHARYGMLETIRQFAEEQLAAAGTIDEVRDRHAATSRSRPSPTGSSGTGPATASRSTGSTPSSPTCAPGSAGPPTTPTSSTAAAIAAHTTMLASAAVRAVGWAEEILAAATAADLRNSPACTPPPVSARYTGRPDAAVGYAHTAVVLEADPRYDPSTPGWSGFWEAVAHLYAGGSTAAGDLADLAAQTGPRPRHRAVRVLLLLPAVGRAEEALAIAEEAVAAARAHGNPFWIAWRSMGTGGPSPRPTRPCPGRPA